MSPENCNILVVDDEPEIAEIAKICLDFNGYRVRIFYDPREVIASARLIRPDLILSDVMMPEISGPEMLEELDKDERTRGIPAILVTANKNSTDQKFHDCLKSKRAILVPKPFDFDYLLKSVEDKLQNNPGLFV